MSSQAHNIIHAVYISSPLYLCCVCAVHRTDMMDWRECGATHNSIAIIRFDAFSLDADALIHDDGIACRGEKRLWIVHMWPRPFSLSSIHNRSLKMFAQYFLHALAFDCVCARCFFCLVSTLYVRCVCGFSKWRWSGFVLRLLHCIDSCLVLIASPSRTLFIWLLVFICAVPLNPLNNKIWTHR